MTIEKRVWDTLSAIDVSGFTEKKLNLTYLSWSHAWSVMCSHYPATHYEFREQVNTDGTVMVECILTIRDGDEVMTRMGWLPVMNYKNQAIANPDAFAINTARMRCLTKTLSLCGLGIAIYAGEDIKSMAEIMTKDEPIGPEQIGTIEQLITATETDVERFCKAYKVESVGQLVKAQFEHAKSTLERKLAKMEAAE